MNSAEKMHKALLSGSSEKVSQTDNVKQFDALLLAYSPSRQTAIAANRHDCFFGQYPTLAGLRKVLDTMPIAWLTAQLFDLSEYCGCRDKLSDYALEECAKVISAEFYYLKVSELMLFFYQFKAGYYGHFYGAVDAMIITEALHAFTAQRADEYERNEQRNREQHRKRYFSEAVSYNDYIKSK